MTMATEIPIGQFGGNELNILMDYLIEIKEFLSRQIKVVATSEEEAILQVKKQYLESNIVLDANDFVDFEINILQN